MKIGLGMLAGSVLSSWGIVAFLGSKAGPGVRPAVWLGMLAPLAVTMCSAVMVERTFRRNPEGLTQVMIAAFAAKMIFLGGYVALVIAAGWVQPVPFAISFTGYFLSLHIIEALRLYRLFSTTT